MGHLDGTATCFINDAEVFGEVLKEQKFPKLWYVYDSFKIMVGDGLVTSKGETWKRQRRLLTPLFHFQKLKQMPDIMNQRIEHLCEKLEGFKGKEVLAVDLFGEMTLEVVIDCVFGGKRHLDAEAMEPLWKSVNVAVNNYFIGDLILGSTLNTITPFPWNFKIKSCMKQIRAMVKRAIDLKREELKNGEQDSDLLASLIQVKDETTGEGIPESLIIDESLTFLFAGHDTTSSLLSWCMSLLAHHPEVVSKIREEISTVLGDRQAKYEDLKNLPYCDNVLKETLRMRPPVPLFIEQLVKIVKLMVKHIRKEPMYIQFSLLLILIIDIGKNHLNLDLKDLVKITKMNQNQVHLL